MTKLKKEIQIDGPANLLATVPYLLGFNPEKSLVIVAVKGQHDQVVVSMTLDLPDKISLVDQLDEKLERKKVLAVLKKMSPDYREILTLYFFEGQSYQEISDILRRPLGTVCTQINRAKKQFKELYQKYVR